MITVIQPPTSGAKRGTLMRCHIERLMQAKEAFAKKKNSRVMKLLAVLLLSLIAAAQAAPQGFFPGFGGSSGQQQQQQQQNDDPLGFEAGDFGGITIDRSGVNGMQQQQQQMMNTASNGYGVYGRPALGNGFYNGYGNAPALPFNLQQAPQHLSNLLG